jgi:DNA gyrase subunit A
VRDFLADTYVIMCTRDGTVKKTALDEFSNPRASGIIAINVGGTDALLSAKITNGTQEVIIATAEGMAIRFKESDVRPMGRYAAGVRGATLEDGDRVIGMTACDPGASILTVSENGYGKRTEIERYRLIRRGGKGVITLKATEKTGKVVAILLVTDEHDIMLITDGGKLIRCGADEIRKAGRNTQGVRLIRTESGEKVVGVAMLAEDDEEGTDADDTAGDAPAQ